MSKYFFNGDKLIILNELINCVSHLNLLTNSAGEFKPVNADNPIDIDQYKIYQNVSINMINGETYTVSAQTNGNFTNIHDTSKVSNNCVLWLTTQNNGYATMISSDNTKTGTTFTWNAPSGTYYLRVNRYGKDSEVKAWNIKIEKGNAATPWTPSPEDL